MKNITVIIPVHDASDSAKSWLNKAITSINLQKDKPEKTAIVHCDCPDVIAYFDALKAENNPILDGIDLIHNTGSNDFSSQINFAANVVTTKYISILELDDEYSNTWFKNVGIYSEAYPNVDLFLPIVVDTDEDGNFLSFTNESVWAFNFAEEQGILNNDSLLNYNNFQTSGMVIDREKFLEIGGFKSNIKLAFVYEFLLRATYNDLRVMTIPKFGYKHTNMREDSLFWNYKNNKRMQIFPEEAKFWIEAAKKEYFFKNDRQINYAPKNV